MPHASMGTTSLIQYQGTVLGAGSTHGVGTEVAWSVGDRWLSDVLDCRSVGSSWATRPRGLRTETSLSGILSKRACSKIFMSWHSSANQWLMDYENGRSYQSSICFQLQWRAHVCQCYVIGCRVSACEHVLACSIRLQDSVLFMAVFRVF